MVDYDAVLQAFYHGDGAQDVSMDDVMLFVNHDMESADERFIHLGFTPTYYADARLRWSLDSAHGIITSERMLELNRFAYSDDFRFRRNDEQNWKDTLATAEMFICLAFDLFELLQNPSEHRIEESTLSRFYAFRDDDYFTRDGFARYSVSFEIPSCDYIMFAASGCEKISKAPIYTDCMLKPIQAGEVDPYIGWLASKSGGILTYSNTVPDNQTGYELYLKLLLKFLLDLHLHDVQLVTYGVGEYRLLATHALAALWVKLREELAGGRAGICRVCGRHFVAHNERKEKARYCQPRGACSQAFNRTKLVLNDMNDGATLEEAASKVAGISAKRVADIASRNRFALQRDFPNIDFDKLAEGR